MNPITNMKNLNKMNDREIEMGVAGTGTSWHNEYKDSAWIFTGGLPYDLTEGDVICVFSQYGEIVHINLIRDHKTGKSKGFGFICYEDQRSTVLAVDNLNGMKLLGRLVRVDHVHTYKLPKDLEKMDEDRKKLFLEGCAPKPIEQAPIEDESEEEEELLDYKSETKKKKSKKSKKKSKKKHKKKDYSSDSSDSDETSDDSSKHKKKNKKKHKRRDNSSESDEPSEDVVKHKRDHDQKSFKRDPDIKRRRSVSRDRSPVSRDRHRDRSPISRDRHDKSSRDFRDKRRERSNSRERHGRSFDSRKSKHDNKRRSSSRDRRRRSRS